MQKRTGFTLIELLVVVSIIALLVSILLPALGRAKDQARQVLCLMNTKQFGMALVMYSQDNQDYSVTGRWAGMRLDVPAWYTMMTHYLDPGQPELPDDFLTLPFTEKAKYNYIWNKMICPSERHTKQEDSIHGVSQGINMLTCGIHYGPTHIPADAHGVPRNYANGYGLFDWFTAKSRKMTTIRNSQSMMAFTDVRDTDYCMANLYVGCKTFGEDADWFMPIRHPGGYMVTCIDGHSEPVSEDIIRDEANEYLDYPIWKID